MTLALGGAHGHRPNTSGVRTNPNYLTVQNCAVGPGQEGTYTSHRMPTRSTGMAVLRTVRPEQKLREDCPPWGSSGHTVDTQTLRSLTQQLREGLVPAYRPLGLC